MQMNFVCWAITETARDSNKVPNINEKKKKNSIPTGTTRKTNHRLSIPPPSSGLDWWRR